MKKSLTAVALTLSAISAAHARLPTIPLKCGNAYDAVAVRQHIDSANSGGGGIYNINITFSGQRPVNAKVEAAMRACLMEATKKDATTDAMASAWFKARQGASDNDDEQLSPFGFMQTLVYTAATKTVAVREPELKKK
jgi:hypothetical protein